MSMLIWHSILLNMRYEEYSWTAFSSCALLCLLQEARHSQCCLIILLTLRHTIDGAIGEQCSWPCTAATACSATRCQTQITDPLNRLCPDYLQDEKQPADGPGAC